MYLIYFLLGIGALLTAIFANLSADTVLFLVVITLLFLLIGTFTLIKTRFESQRRSERQIISPEELHYYHEQAKKNKSLEKASPQ
jgi:hypothetical protein